MDTQRLLYVAALILLLSKSAFGDALAVWHPRNPLPTPYALNGVAYGAGRFVAVGEVGTMVVSTDGLNWSLYPTGLTNKLAAIAFAEGRFVVGGSAGLILWSDDGLDWTRASFPIANRVDAIGFGTTTNFPKGIFVATASTGITPATTILTSSNGIDWLTNALFHSGTLYGAYSIVGFGNDRLVASGENPNGSSGPTAMFSTDGTNWSFGQAPGNWRPSGSIAFGNGLFVMANAFYRDSKGLSLTAATSSDGHNWPQIVPPLILNSLGICFGGEHFVAVGAQGAAASSTDGTNWICIQTQTSANLRAVTYAGGLYVAVGSGGLILTSTDSLHWSRQGEGNIRTLLRVDSDGDGFVAVGLGGTIVRSTNGVVWDGVVIPTTNDLLTVVRAGGRCVVGGGGGTILSGDDTTNLSARTSGTEEWIEGLAFGADSFVAVGTAGTILSSPDAATWSTQSSPTTNYLADVVFGSGQFITVGGAGTILSSSNGISWQTQVSGTTLGFSRIRYGGGHFVALAVTGAQVRLAVSADGITWEIVGLSTFGTAALGYGDGYFLLTTEFGMFATPDGKNWNLVSVLSNYPLGAANIGFNNGTFLAVGSNGAIYQSDPIVRLQARYDGLARLWLEGPRPGTYRIDGVTGTDDWQPLTTVSNSPCSWTDLSSAGASNRCYRAVLLP